MLVHILSPLGESGKVAPFRQIFFVTIVEILAQAIRKNLDVLRLLLGMKEFKIAQLADDTFFQWMTIHSRWLKHD
jgi:hypothetical protein